VTWLKRYCSISGVMNVVFRVRSSNSPNGVQKRVTRHCGSVGEPAGADATAGSP
jgi:hypothetical protein